jgi:hypothetical protein
MLDSWGGELQTEGRGRRRTQLFDVKDCGRASRPKAQALDRAAHGSAFLAPRIWSIMPATKSGLRIQNIRR